MRILKKRLLLSFAFFTVAFILVWYLLVGTGPLDFSKKRHDSTSNTVKLITEKLESAGPESEEERDAFLAGIQARYPTVDIYTVACESGDGILLVPRGLFGYRLARPRLLMSTVDYEIIEEMRLREVKTGK